MNRVWFALMLVTVALSGCASDDGNGSDDPVVEDFRDQFEDQNDGTDNDQETDPETGTGEEEETVDTVVLNPTLVADANAANAPATITFTVDATAANEEGNPVTPENVTWALFDQAGDLGLEASGDALPGTAEFTFETEGNYTIVAGVNAKGADETFVNITVQILAAEAEVPPPAAETWWLYMESNCGADGALKKTEGGPGGACFWSDGPLSAAESPDSDAYYFPFFSEGNSAGFPVAAPFVGSATFYVAPALTPNAVMDIQLFAGSKMVFSKEIGGIGPAPGPTVSISWDETLDDAIPAGSALELRLRLRDAASWGYGFPVVGGTGPDSFTLG